MWIAVFAITIAISIGCVVMAVVIEFPEFGRMLPRLWDS